MIHLFARDVDYDEFLNLDIDRGLLIATLSGASRRASDDVFWEVLQSQLEQISDLNGVTDSQFIESINRILLMPGFYDRVSSQVNVNTLDPEVQTLAEKAIRAQAEGGTKLSSKERRALNKALLLQIYSTEIQPTNRNGWLKEGLSDAKQDDDKTTYLLRNLKNIRMNDSIRGEYYLDLLKEYGERVLVFVRHGPLEKPFDYQAEFRWLVTGTANLFGRINANDHAIADVNIDRDEFWPLWEGFNGKMITVVDSKGGAHKIRIPIPVIDGSLTPDGRLLFLDARHKEECYRMQLYIERAKWLINKAIEENKEPPQFEGYGDTHNALMTWVLEQPIDSARMDAWDSRGYDERLSGPQSRFRNKVPGKSEVYSVTPFDAEIGMSAKDFVKGIAKANQPLGHAPTFTDHEEFSCDASDLF
ncbi:MAG TPA: hypothetical protein PK590_02810 [Candidatus Omnitrophota bacterium]|nr:hypothetical protein [Candidatus Omnitrophota bacterium]